MSLNKNTNLTLNELAQRQDPDGKIAKVIEVLVERNEILEDMVFVKANDKSGHKTTVRSGYPEGTWRKLNWGVQPEKSKTTQVRDSCGMLESYSEVDKDLAELSGDIANFRGSEDTAFIEGMAQTMAKAFVYGDSSVDPEKIMGFAPRFNDKKAENGVQIIDAGGTGNNLTSMWLIGWSELTVHGIYKEGGKAGMQVNDLGEETLNDADGGKFQGFRTHFKFDAGLVVRDWRYVVRIANIPADLAKVDLVGLINEAIELIPNLSAAKCVFYCNRKLRTALRNKIKNTENVNLSLETVNGKRELQFDGLPVKRVDQILSTEEQVK